MDKINKKQNQYSLDTINLSTSNISNKTSSEEKVDLQTNKIKLDVSGLSSLQKRFLSFGRKINFIEKIKGQFNSYTIMAGASRKWEKARLKKGKHITLAQIGAEHIELTSSTNCKVDAHFLNAITFIQSLEKMGGKRSIFQFQVKNDLLFKGIACELDLDDAFPLEVQEIALSKKQQLRDKYGFLLIQDHLSAVIGEPVQVIEDLKNNKFYVVNSLNYDKLMSKNAIDEHQCLTKGKISTTEKTTSLISEKTEFPAIKFEKNSSDWQKAVEVLEELKIQKSSWTIVEKDTAIYLVPSQHASKLNLKHTECNLKESLINLPLESIERGTVLLTTNQSDIYEQYSHEMLTFLLEGVNVMAYNNPSKGLSTGVATGKNINASIEASYQYLKSLGIADEKILAKGQCFGGAPTAWLGRQHPNINLMLDQNPANFYELGIMQTKRIGERLLQQNQTNLVDTQTEQLNNLIDDLVKKYPKLTKLGGKILTNDFLVNSVTKLILGFYDVTRDIKYSKGHKIININVKDVNGHGGDHLVPEHHPQQMIDAIQYNKGKIVTLSQNPGATHVTDWWIGHESQETVIEFLRRTKISESLFPTKNIVFEKETTWLEKIKGSFINVINKVNKIFNAIFLEIIFKPKFREIFYKE